MCRHEGLVYTLCFCDNEILAFLLAMCLVLESYLTAKFFFIAQFVKFLSITIENLEKAIDMFLKC